MRSIEDDRREYLRKMMPYRVGEVVIRRVTTNDRLSFIGVLTRLYWNAGALVAQITRADGNQLALTATSLKRPTISEHIEHLTMGGRA